MHSELPGVYVLSKLGRRKKIKGGSVLHSVLEENGRPGFGDGFEIGIHSVSLHVKYVRTN